MAEITDIWEEAPIFANRNLNSIWLLLPQPDQVKLRFLAFSSTKKKHGSICNYFIERLILLLSFLVRSGFGTTARPKSLALPGSTKGTVRALYAYLSSGEHQINFLEGDLILLLGDEPVSFHSNANGIKRSHHCYM